MYLVSDKLKSVIFADDTNLLHTCDNINTLVKEFNTELGKYNDWFKANKLSLNCGKTKFILFTKKKMHHIAITN